MFELVFLLKVLIITCVLHISHAGSSTTNHPNVTSTSVDRTNPVSGGDSQHIPTAAMAEVAMNTTAAAVKTVVRNANDTATAADDDDDEVEGIRSRNKSDTWHEHYNVPLRKDCPVSPFLHQLVTHATSQ